MSETINLHPHTPTNANETIAAERTSFNDWLALLVTRSLGNMWAAYLFVLLAIIGFPGFHATPVQYVQWLSQTFIQLVALSILAVGQRLLSRHAELQANEQYLMTKKLCHDHDVLAASQEEIRNEIQTIMVILKQWKEMSNGSNG